MAWFRRELEIVLCMEGRAQTIIELKESMKASGLPSMLLVIVRMMANKQGNHKQPSSLLLIPFIVV